MNSKPLAAIVLLASALVALAIAAANSEPARVRGAVVSLDGAKLVVHPKAGADVTVTLADAYRWARHQRVVCPNAGLRVASADKGHFCRRWHQFEFLNGLLGTQGSSGQKWGYGRAGGTTQERAARQS